MVSLPVLQPPVKPLLELLERRMPIHPVQLVGTDLTQAVPLTLAAALGALTFGHVEFSVTTSIIIGSVPAVLVGALISSRAPDRLIARHDRGQALTAQTEEAEQLAIPLAGIQSGEQ